MNRLSDTLSWVGLFRLMSMIIILLVYFPTINKKPRGDPPTCSLPWKHHENMSNPRRILPAIPYIPQQKEAPYPTEARFTQPSAPHHPRHQPICPCEQGPIAWLATGVKAKKWLCLLVLTFCRSCHFKKMFRKLHSSTFNRKIVRGSLHFVAELSLGWDQPNYM